MTTLPDTHDDTAVRASLERQLVAAVGWCAEQGARRGVNPELIADAARRRILELLLAQTDEHGASAWTTVLDVLLPDGDPEVVAELPRCATAGGYPSQIPLLLAHVEAHAEADRAWTDAVAEVERRGFRVVPAEEVGA